MRVASTFRTGVSATSLSGHSRRTMALAHAARNEHPGACGRRKRTALPNHPRRKVRKCAAHLSSFACIIDGSAKVDTNSSGTRDTSMATDPAHGHATSNLTINKLLAVLVVRAEVAPDRSIAASFVALPQVANSLLRLDHQVLYGRRGTGKTHALRNLAVSVWNEGSPAVYVDMRKLGSNGGLYSDTTKPVSLRATQLLIDSIEAIHTELLRIAIEEPGFESLLPHLDAIAEAATDVHVDGPVALEQGVSKRAGTEASHGWQFKGKWANGGGIGGSAGSSANRTSATETTQKLVRKGDELPHVHFGKLGKALESAAKAIKPRRLWILLDEWSSIPTELQPVLADMLRRAVFPCDNTTLKIASIERRTRFIQRVDAGTYCGFEPGADTAAALNLDEYLLGFDETSQARSFFSQVLFRHLRSLAQEKEIQFSPQDAGEFLRAAFAEKAFTELVRAAEGIPRDALNIAGLAATTAMSRPIRIDDIRSAARKFFIQDKETGINGNDPALSTWLRLQKEVLHDRKSRTFLVKRDRDHSNAGLLDLYDARVIHLLQAGLSKRNQPGVGFDGYAIDFGSYVNVMREEELAAIQEARNRVWAFDQSGAFLPDRFDEGVVFHPRSEGQARQPRPKSGRTGSR